MGYSNLANYMYFVTCISFFIFQIKKAQKKNKIKKKIKIKLGGEGWIIKVYQINNNIDWMQISVRYKQHF